MGLNWQPLVQPGVAIALAGGFWKLLTNLLNHKATINSDKVVDSLQGGFKLQTQTLAMFFREFSAC